MAAINFVAPGKQSAHREHYSVSTREQKVRNTSTCIYYIEVEVWRVVESCIFIYVEQEVVNASFFAKTITASNQTLLDEAFFTARRSQPHFKLNSNLFPQ